MRIGFDIRTVGKNRTGDETVTLQLVKNVLALDKKNKFFLFTDEKKRESLEEIKGRFGEGKNFSVNAVLPAKKAFWTLWSLPKFLRKSPIDVLHVQYIIPLWLPNKVKLITTIHDISFARHPQYISKKDLILLKAFIPLSLRKADKIVAVSEFTKREIMDVYGIEKEKIEVVYNGGAAEIFFEEVSQKERELFIEEKGLGDNFLLYVGTLQPRKNIPFLLQSFVEFKQKYAANDEKQKLELVIGGNRAGHNYDKTIDEKYEEIKRKFPEIAADIKFVGFIKDEELPLFYKTAKCVCISSEYEGFGLPAIEAMASGVPVLSTDASCMQEICGEAAMIYRHNDAEDFTSKLEKVIYDDGCANRLIEAGSIRARNFSWKRAAKETLSIYQNI